MDKEAIARTLAETAELDWSTLPDEPDAACGYGMPEGCKRYWRRLATAILALQPSERGEGDTVAFVQKWMMSGDHEADRWHRDFAAAIDARATLSPAEPSPERALREALRPFAALQLPARCEGNAAIYSILHEHIIAARDALQKDSPMDERGSASPCAAIFDHTWLDPECAESGCQSLRGRHLMTRLYEVVHHEDECKAIGGSGDADCTCDAIPLLRELETLWHLPVGTQPAAIRALSAPAHD